MAAGEATTMVTRMATHRAVPVVLVVLVVVVVMAMKMSSLLLMAL